MSATAPEDTDGTPVAYSISAEATVTHADGTTDADDPAGADSHHDTQETEG